jgi:hypothetical protein
MKASRAYITSLGTTGLLLCFALLLLVVVSALTAFRGWPGQAAGGDDSAAVRIDSGREAAHVKRVRQTTAAATASTQRAAERAPAPARRARKAGNRDTGAVGGVSRQGAAAPAPAEPAQAPAEPQAAPQQTTVDAPQAPRAEQLQQGLADTTRQVTEGVGGALDSVGAAPLGDAVRQTGDTTVRSLPKLP